MAIGIGSTDRSSRLVEPRPLFPFGELPGIEARGPVDVEAVHAASGRLQPVGAPMLEVPESIHQPLTPEVDLEGCRVMRGRSRDVVLTGAVELPQLGQLLQELVDRCCIATPMLRV